MDLSEALGDWPAANSQAGGQQQNPSWPGQPSNPSWPGGQPAANPSWPGGQPAANPSWPGGQPAANPSWPGGPWPGANPSQSSWPSPQPNAPGGWPSPGPGPGVPAALQQILTVPYKQNLPSGIHDKVLVVIAGTIKPNADKITVNMSTDKDVAFHFNPRFNEGGKRVIVRNSCLGQKWGREERELQNFPFVPGQPFEMKILCTNTEFKVAVNNVHLLEFKHRIPDLRAIKSIDIFNDLTLSRVEVQTLP